MINFKGHLVDRINISSKNQYGQFVDKKVALVEFDPSSQEDKQTIESIDKYWGYKGLFAYFFNNEFQDFANKLMDEDLHFYCLTTQRNNFEKLSKNKILAVAEINNINEDLCKLETLQTSPSYYSSNKNRTMKNVGRSLVQYLIKYMSSKSMEVFSYEPAIKFYKKCGFVETSETGKLIINKIKKSL